LTVRRAVPLLAFLLLSALLLGQAALAASSSATCNRYVVPVGGNSDRTFASPGAFTAYHLIVEPRVDAYGRFAAHLADGEGKEVANHRAFFVGGTDVLTFAHEVPPAKAGTWRLLTHSLGAGLADVAVCFG
jgi:hypothetical protein